ncbi:MAG: MMPL family transporter, partial [Acidimicrobiia bacterium]|nr:MMPL family transporter [Acidimicrobiia bacterium]
PAGADVTPLYQAMVAAVPDRASGVLHFDGDRVDAVLFDISTQAGEAGADELRVALIDAFAPLEGQADFIPTSDEIISAVIVDALASSQTQSLLITLVIASLVLMISFWIENRRPFLGVITMLPVALVVFWTYGLMYATGIPFGPVTATLAALAVGIGVPFTIHIARRFEEDRLRFATLGDALRSTTRHTGAALAGSAFTTMAGFGILMSSTLTPFQQMGQVTVYAIGLSLIGAILVLPSLLALWEAWHRRRGDALVEQPTESVV